MGVNIQIMLLLLNMFHMLEIVNVLWMNIHLKFLCMEEIQFQCIIHAKILFLLLHILDLLILSELISRITYKTGDMEEYERFHPILSVLSYLLKAPLVPSGAPVVNALFKQRACIENILKACVGLPPENDMGLEHRTKYVYKC